MKNEGRLSFNYIALTREPDNLDSNTSISSRSPEEMNPISHHSKFQPILDAISRAEKPKTTKCPGDAISIAAMIAFGASAYLFGFLQNTYTTSHSNKMNEWQYQAQLSNATCDNILGEIIDYGMALPYILNISQNSSASLQSCEALHDSILTLDRNSSIFQGAMITSLTLLATIILNRVATIKNRILINNLNEPEFNDEQSQLLKNNKIVLSGDVASANQIKENILLHSELCKHFDDNIAGIILDHFRPTLSPTIQEKILKASTLSATILHESTAFLTKQSTPKMALIHAACVGFFLAFLKFNNAYTEHSRLQRRAERIWSYSLIPHNNKTCLELYGKCDTGDSNIEMPTIEQACEIICRFTDHSLLYQAAALASIMIAYSCLLYAAYNLYNGAPIPLNTILTNSELSFLRSNNINGRHLTTAVRAEIARLTTSLGNSDEEEKSDVESYGGGPPLVGPSLP